MCSVAVQQFQAPDDGLVGRNMLCSLVYWVSGVRIKKVAVKTEKYIEYSSSIITIQASSVLLQNVRTILWILWDCVVSYPRTRRPQGELQWNVLILMSSGERGHLETQQTRKYFRMQESEMVWSSRYVSFLRDRATKSAVTYAMSNISQVILRRCQLLRFSHSAYQISSPFSLS
jgi:hypothetical protein